MMILNDFHCHLYTYDSGAVMNKIVTWILDQQKEISVGMMFNNIREESLWERGCGTDAASCALSRASQPIAVQENYAGSEKICIVPFIGIHPWDSAKASEETINSLEEISSKTGAFIGEFGFDKLKGADKEKQLLLFRGCLEIALKNEKPFTIHCVRSWGILTEELQKVKQKIKAPFIIHAYNGTTEVAKTIISLGGYPCFGLEKYGAFSRKAADSISKINLKHILLETDFTCYSNAGLAEQDNDSENSINVEYSREDNYYGKKYIKRLLAVYNEAALVLKMDIAELSGVIEENGKIFKTYTVDR